MKIVVYTSITAGKDTLKAPRDSAGADFVVFSDQPSVVHDCETVNCWRARPACALFVDPRRNSRAPKLLAHQYVPGYDFSLWIDGSFRLLASPAALVEEYLSDADVALFRHSTRECIYDEAEICSTLRLDDPAIIEEQGARYRLEGYPARQGLTEGGVILRRHNSLMERVNDAWWSEYCRHSRRDQLSFNYVLYKLGVRCSYLPGTVLDNPGIVSFEGHLH